MKFNLFITKNRFLSLLFLLFFTAYAFAQDYVKVTAIPSRKEFNVSENVKINLKAVIQQGFHINANKIKDEDLIPTTVNFEDGNFKIVKISYPPSESYKFSFSETELDVYAGSVNFGLNLKPKKNLKPGKYEISGSIHYQACNDRACFAPKDAPFSASVIIKEDTVKSEIKQDTVKKIDTTGLGTIETKTNIPQVISSENNEISGSLQEKGLFLTLILIFLGGLALNLTPCVYPLIPITVSYFGAQVSHNKTQQILMAVVYVLGMSVTYSALGLIAALTGSLFGSALQNPIVVSVIAAVIVTLALSMFGLFEIRIPSALANFSGKNRSGYVGTALMGLTVGFIAAPCIGPFVLSLLVYVGQLGNPFTGFLFFFILSLGLGLPYVFLALFSNSIRKLPRSGEWMDGVKIIFGFVLIGLALYTLQTLIPRYIYDFVFPLYIIFSGVYLILIDRKALKSAVYTKIKYAIAIAAIIIGSYSFNLGKETGILKFQWHELGSKSDIEQSINGTKDKPTLIDFTADWCAACKELEKYTYTDTKVIELSRKFNNIRVDLTKENKEISDKFKILGLPVVAFFDKNGNEIQNLRVTGFVKPEEFSNTMEKALSIN